MKTPPLLIGAAILFWGLTMHQLVLAALMAFGVEASRWIKHRWELNESDFKRASTLCTMALIGLAFYQFLTGWLNHPAWMVFQWLPAVLLPLLLAQVYSTAGRIDPRVLFLLRKKQILSAHSKNKPIDFSFIYLAACVFSTGFVNQRSGLFYIGLLGLSVWALWSYRPRHSPWAFWMILLLIAGGAGYLGQIGLAKLQTVVEQKTTHFFSPSGDSYRKYTQIGDVPNEKLSSRIVFRARPGGSDQRSLLLREATYDTFRSFPSIWSVSRKYFNRLHKSADSYDWQLATPAGPARSCTIAQQLKGKDALLKIPSGSFQIDNLRAERAEKNDFGAVKVRGDGLISYTVQYGLGSSLISPPGSRDLAIPKHELKVITQIAEQLNLRTLPPAEILKTIKTHFETEFTYSLKAKSKHKKSTPISNFLTQTRSGHCEYFATATVLLLRQAGIPARYVRGYSVNPSDTMGGWSLVRSRYAHAWTVAYVDGRWINLDTTPATWQETEGQQLPRWQHYWQKIRDVTSGVIFWLSQWRLKIQGSRYLKYFPLLLLPLFIWAGWRMMARFLKGRKFKRTVRCTPKKGLPVAGADSAFYPIEQRLNQLGFTRYPWETLSKWLKRIEGVVGQRVSIDIPRQVLAFHYRYRFDPKGLSAADKSHMIALSATWLDEHQADRGS